MFESSRLDNHFASLGEGFYSLVSPQGLNSPHWVSINPDACKLLGLQTEALRDSEEALAIFSGNQVPAGSQPLAMIYSGHQFGSYNPQLGDGRGILLGEYRSAGKHWDIHLKGAGMTPYSRSGDGRAVLRSSIREYLCSEAMHHLGIPTTRALCIVGSDTPVYRETPETGAIVTRLAESHIRFGSFEYFHYTQQHNKVKQLADHVIAHHFTHLQQSATPYRDFLGEVIKGTAHLIAHWQAVGFAHGVMNTDNMSILSQTFDYGPYGFLDDYDPGFICNHSDYNGRYAFNQQPGIGLWNLNALAHALSSLISTEDIKECLAEYEPTIVAHYSQLMRNKCGLTEARDSDQSLVQQFLNLLHSNKVDYSIAFRQLCDFDEQQENATLRDLFVDREAFDQWATDYKARLKKEPSDTATRQQQMKRCNPKYILRNYLAQQAIDQATEQQDFTAVDRLLSILRRPYDEQPEHNDYAKAPPDWGKKLAISCSS